MRFDVLPNVLIDPFSVSTPIGKSIMAKRIYRNFLISLSHIITTVDLVEIVMFDSNVNLGIYFLHSSYGSIDCTLRVVKFQNLERALPRVERGKFYA